MPDNELNEAVLLEDAKLKIKEKFAPDNSSKSSFDLLMRSFVYHIETNSDAKDYENKENKFAHEIYPKLGWDDNEYFDVINSFWTTFSWIMHIEFPLIYKEKEYGNIGIYKKHYKDKDYDIPSFPEKYINTLGSPEYKSEISKKKHEKCKSHANTVLSKYNRLDEFAAKCHCIANFMPCPGNGYNSVKGVCAAQDYFPLMIDLIQECMDKCEPLEYYKDKKKMTIKFETVQEWHQWFIDNRENYCLDDYYEIIEKDGKKILKGKPFFKEQKLDNPYPETKEQAQECINEMLKRIYKRAELIIERYNENKGNKNG